MTMRLTVAVLAIASFLGACNGDKKEESTQVQTLVPADSSRYNNSVLSDTGSATVVKVAPPAPVVVAKKPVVKKPAPKPVTKPAPVYQDNSPATSTNTTTSTEPSAPVNTTPAPAPVPEKKGMNGTAKGAIIGGVGGAIGGAIISKKKGTGALIGGLLGAGAGAIIGRKKDKKKAADTIPRR